MRTRDDFKVSRSTGRVGPLHKTPSIQERLEGIEDTEERQRIWDEFHEHIDSVMGRFKNLYPHIPLDDESEAGLHNQKTIAEWINTHFVGCELHNFIECVQDAYRQIYFTPSAAGRPDLSKSPRLGSYFEPRLNSVDFSWLFESHPAYQKADLYEPEKSAKQYREAHPEAWKFQTDQVAAADAAFVAQQVKQFLELRPQFVSTDANKKMLLDAVKEAGLKINQSSLMLCFDNLVKVGKMTGNESVSLKFPGVTRTDFAEANGEGSGRDIGLAETQKAALKFVASHTAEQIRERTQKDPAFRAALDRLRQ